MVKADVLANLPGGLKFLETLPEWNDVVKSLEDDVFTYYRWDDKFDEDLNRIYHPIFDLLKESSEGLVICARLQ